MLLRTFAIVFFSFTSLVGLTLLADPSVGAPQQELKRAEMVVETTDGEVRLSPEVARTPVEQEIGLMGRSRPAGSAGMYFPQPKPGIVEIPAAGAGFAVDVVFVGEDGLITRIDTIGHSGKDGFIRSPGKVSGYLQMSAGTPRRLGIRPGDRLKT